MKKLTTLFFVTIFLSLTAHTNAGAATDETYTEYYDDGSYAVISIQDAPADTFLMNASPGISTCASTTTTTKSKTVNYYNASKKLLWYLKVTGGFTYGNGSARCNYATVEAKSYNDCWKLSGRTSVTNANMAIGCVIAKLYRGSTVVETKHETLTLTCSPTGKFS